ncbi:Axial budding pattern protein 2 [Cytospora mali]|uniref:Axial budding pattern protein 2 n=1 Tax=Cytospora mali TaxID=578113 RepID=A0A194VCP6_CYTMA|nr:Axial budding pattern protein 2 [Valsa mali var. pyri (nom. inval.)]
MLSVARKSILLTFLSRAVVVVQAAPTVSFPINSQVPPVARISQPFSFVFSSSTFTSSSGSALSYSLTDPPPWLSVDSDNRTIYGTPQDGDVAPGTVVGVPIALVATDSTGSTSLNATLVVSRDAGPTVQIPVSDQIQSFGAYSDPASILLYPDKPFKFAFAQDTFSDPINSNLNYYAVTIDDSPLPAWVSFDPVTLAFTGTTPPFYSLIEPPQTFSLKLTASDVVGFSAASVNFSIVVGSHGLTANQPTITLNAAAGTPVSYDGLIGNVKIDGSTAAVSDVPNVSTDNLPSWLTFDPSTWNISGTPPDAAQSTSFYVMMEDAFLDTLNITFEVQVANNDSVFQAAFPTLNLKPGGQLSFDLRPYLLDPSDVDIAVDIQPSTSWLQFDATALSLSGHVPKSAPKSVIDVTFSATPKTAKLRRDGTAQTQKLTIQVLSAAESTSEPTSSTPSATTSTPKASSSPGNKSVKQRFSPVLVAVLVSSIVAVLILICLLFCFYRRRQKRHSRTPLEGNESCGPKPGSFIHTQGFDPDSSVLDLNQPQYEVVRTKSAAEKTKPRKPSNLRLEYTGSPDVMTPPLPVIVYDVASQSNFSPSKAWLAPLRNFRIPHLKRLSIRAAESFFDDDDRRGLGLDFPPPISLSRGSHNSFRNDIEVAIPTVEREDSIQQTPEFAYGANPMIRGPPPRNPARVQDSDEAVDHINRDISPVDNSEIVNEKKRHQPASDNDPQYEKHPALRHEKSQKSFASFSSIDTFRDQTRKLAAKATASAKGAASLANSAIVQVPKRKTLRALGKARLHFNESPTAGQGIFETVCSPARGDSYVDYINSNIVGAGYISPRSWPQNDPGAPSSVPTPRRPAGAVALDSEDHRRRMSRMSGSSSSRSSGHLSVGHGRTGHGASLGTGAVRRPSGGGGGGIGASASDDFPAFPTPLRVRNPDSSAGLGISGYEDIANSSPFHPSRSTNSWSTVQTGLSGGGTGGGGFERSATAKTMQSGTGTGTGTGRSFRSGTWIDPNVVIHEEESPTFEEAVGWLGRSVSGGDGGQGGSGPGRSRQDRTHDYRRKSLSRSGHSGGSGDSDGPPAFL